MLDYKAKWQGKRFVKVNPAYTSHPDASGVVVVVVLVLIIEKVNPNSNVLNVGIKKMLISMFRIGQETQLSACRSWVVHL